MSRRQPALLYALALALVVAACQRGLDDTPTGGSSAPTSGTAPFPGAPVILISIDTLRADRLPAWGYDRVETPSIDALAADSILFESAFSHVPLTLPSHLSVLTGRLPNEHGVRNNLGYRFDAAAFPTLAQLATGAGYDTAAAVSAYVLRADTGVASGFALFDDVIPSQNGVAAGALQRPGDETVAVARRWLERSRESPLLYFLHLFEPHAPYQPREPFRSRYADAYDGEVATVDAILGDFLAALRELGLYDRSLIVLFSDHGEGLGEHGETEHGVFLYREAIHVPLLLKLPHGEGAGRRIARPVQLVDLLPTVCALVGLEPPRDLPGVSLLEDSLPEQSESRPVYSESLFPRIHLGWSELYSIVDRRHHFIAAPRPELYDLAADPGEMRNVLEEERATARRLSRILEGVRSVVTPPATVDPVDAERLAALGYLGSTAAPRAGGELPDPKDRIGELEDLRRAFALAAQNERRAAVEVLRGLLRSNPRAMDARNKLALVLDELGHLEEAVEVYRNGLELDPTLASEYALAMASILRKLGRHEEAREHAELALATYGPRARVLLSKIALDRGDLPAAVATAREVTGDSTSELAAQVVLARVEVQRGNEEQALARLDASSARRDELGLAPVEGLELTRGDALARLERGAEAEAAFSAEIEAFPEKPEPYARLAVLYRVAGRWADVHDILETLVERVPTVPAHLLAARTLEALGDRDRADRLRRRADALADAAPVCCP